MIVQSANDKTLPENIAQRLAELTAELAVLSHRVQIIEDYRGSGSPAQQTNLTIHSYDDDGESIQFLTENGFVIVRPWEANNTMQPGAGAFRFRVQDPEGIEREISVGIPNRLQQETALRTCGRIEAASQFWICCAERRLANYLMEHGEFPAGNEMMIESLEREDLLLALRWGKAG